MKLILCFVVCFVFVLFLTTVFAIPSNIYGATVNWRPADNNTIVFSYRLFWEQLICLLLNKPLLECRKTFITTTINQSNPNYFLGHRWLCTSGCSGTISTLRNLYFIDIGNFHEIKYESGIESIEYKFSSTDNLANIKIGLESKAGTLMNGLGECHLSMAVRNDTRRPNISPVLNVFPVTRVPLGCSTYIKLFPFDGDGDYVKCHWYAFPKPDDKEFRAILNEDMCTIHITADRSTFNVNDTLQLSLYAEDHSRKPVQLSGVSNVITTGPFSRSPVKLMVFIGTASARCSSGPDFTKRGTLKPYFKRSYMLPFKYTLVKLPFETDDSSNTILTTGPRYMTFEQHHNVTSVDEGVWDNLTDTSMKGIHQACGRAYTADGVPGESRCAVLMVNEPDECESNLCTRSPGGICDNLFEYYTCTYPDDPTFDHVYWKGPCEPEIIVKETKENLGVKVGVPVAVSLLLLLIIVGATVYLKRYLTEKLQNSTVKPENTELPGVKM